MVFTYPMESYVARHCIFQVFFVRLGRQTGLGKINKDLALYGIGFLLWVICVTIGCTMEELGIVLDLTGTFGASVLCFIFPCLIHLRIEGFHFIKDRAVDSWKGNKSEAIKDRCGNICSFI